MNATTRRILGCLVVSTASLTLASQAMAAEYTVGVIQSLTGGAAYVGAPIRDGIMIAVDEINEKQLLGPGNTLKVVVGDDAFDRGQAITLVNRMAVDPKVLMIMGPTSGPVALAGGQAATAAKITSYAVTNSHEFPALGPYTFALTQSPRISVPYISAYAIDKLKVKNCVIIGINDNEAYVPFYKMFQDYIVEKGAKVAALETVRSTDTDFTALATKIAAMKDIDCVYISSPPATGGNLVAQMRTAGVGPEVRMIGHTAFATPDFANIAGPAAEGTYFLGEWLPGGQNDAGKAFNDIYKKKHGHDAENFAPLGYSGMMVVAAALKAAGPEPTRESVREAMTKVKDVPVIVGNGLYSMGPDKMPRYGMNVLTIKNGEFVLAP